MKTQKATHQFVPTKSPKAPMRAPYWFRAKTFGWGWTPATWQGWAIVAIYLYVIITMSMSVDARSHSGSDTLIGMTIPFILATTIMIAICYRTGEKPEWRWGSHTIQKGKKSHAK